MARNPRLLTALVDPSSGADYPVDTMVPPVSYGFCYPANAAIWGTLWDSLYSPVPGLSIPNAGAASTVGRLTMLPFMAPRSGTITELAYRVVASGGAGSVFRVGLYSADQGTGYPLSLLVDSGQKDGTITSGSQQTVAVSVDVNKGDLYYGAFNCGVGGPTMLGATPASGGGIISGLAFSNFMASAFWVVLAFGPLPGQFPPPVPAGLATLRQGVNPIPILGVKYAA